MDGKTREQLALLVSWIEEVLNTPQAVRNPNWRKPVAKHLRDVADMLHPPETPDEEVTK